MSRAISEESKALLRFVRARLDERFAALAAVPAPAPPEVRIENQVDVPPAVVHVTVDTAPIAEALRDFGREVAEAVAGALAEALARLPAPEVTVEAPQRPPRTVRITHSDGTTSTVREE